MLIILYIIFGLIIKVSLSLVEAKIDCILYPFGRMGKLPPNPRNLGNRVEVDMGSKLARSQL